MGIDSIGVSGLAKRYGRSRALAGVDLELSSGSICALLGPNGAGKSTLLGILSTLVRPSAGTIQYLEGGQKVAPGSGLRKQIGILAHDSFLYDGLDAIENLTFWSRLYGKAPSSDEIAENLRRVGLEEKAWHRPASTYSRGMTQRLALARTMMHDPAILLLDEPFTGLDRVGASRLTEALAEAKAQGKLVVVVTHDLESIAEVTDHIVVLRRGKIAFERRATQSSYAELKDLYHSHAD